MRTERERLAKKYRAEGDEEARKITSGSDKDALVLLAEAKRESEVTRGQGDAEAVKIYADAYGRDVEFFKLVRTLEAYRKALPVIRLDNPTSQGGSTPATSVVLDVVAYDANGQRITPSEDNPLTVEVYGAPEGTITPVTSLLTSGTSLTLHYDGSYFADPIT